MGRTYRRQSGDEVKKPKLANKRRLRFKGRLHGFEHGNHARHARLQGLSEDVFRPTQKRKLEPLYRGELQKQNSDSFDDPD